MTRPPAPLAVAIVASAGRFPGASDLDAFWRLNAEARSASGPTPAGRWPVEPASLVDPRPGTPDRVTTDRSCYLESWPERPQEVATELWDQLDPLHRLTLAVGLEAWAGARSGALDLARVSVTIANIALPTETTSRLTREVLGRSLEEAVYDAAGAELDGAAGAGVAPANRHVTGLPAALLAKQLGLGGGTMTLDAACASSLYALHLACEDLRAGRADAAIAGGVNGADRLYTQAGFGQLLALSPSGTCRPFDERADGLVVGEGAGLFVLKRLDDAVAQGDDILGVLRGFGLSNDLGGSLLAPDQEGQLRAMEQAYEQAGWTPDEVDLVECHGTGTPRGDSVELESLSTLWRRHPGARTVIGSVKANVGHLLTGAAAAGLTRVLLALRHGALPPSAGWSPDTALEPLLRPDCPLEVLTAVRPWPRPSRHPRRAAVSAFGFGGINGHLLVEEWTGQGATASPAPPPAKLAIVGLAARSGSLDDTAAFLDAALAGGHGFGSRPATRWRGVDQRRWFQRDHEDLLALQGAWIEALEVEPGRFRIPPNELDSLLPQQILLLQVADEAMRDVGLPAGQRLEGPRVGCIAGVALDLETTTWHLRWTLGEQGPRWAARLGAEAPAEWLEALADAQGPALDSARVLGNLASIAASRVARELRLGGPSFAVSADGASGLRALEVAARLLQQGRLDTAVVGAVELAGDVRAVLADHALAPFSTGSRCRPFDAAAPGALPGDAAAAVVVKRYDDAAASGDRIYATIEGLGAADDWPRAIARAWTAAGRDPSEAGLVEAHGAASLERDRDEAEALQAAFDGPRFAAVSSVSGASGAASGLLSVVRAATCLYRAVLPAGERPQRALLALGGPIEPWHGPRVAGVSSASWGGDRLHVVLSAGPASHRPLDIPATERRRAPVKILVGAEPPQPPAPPRRPEPAMSSPALADALGPLVAAQSELLRNIAESMERGQAAHARFLALSQQSVATQVAQLQAQSYLIAALPAAPPPVGEPGPLAAAPLPVQAPDPPSAAPPEPVPPSDRFTREQCLEFAVGSVGAVLGADFAAADDFPTRVRLPDEPLMLVDRIVAVEGEQGSLGGGRVVTEHDVLEHGWYLDGGHMPVCVSVEAGQADLFLSAWLGIDAQTRGEKVYRLLDAEIAFHRDLPRPGEVVRYDIRIRRFIRQGNTWMFFFQFDGTIDGQPLITMRDGCAGFFSDKQLSTGRGIVGELDATPRPRRPGSRTFEALLTPQLTVLDEPRTQALYRGELTALDASLGGVELARGMRLPQGKLEVIHRITELDPSGGRFGLGTVSGVTDNHPDAWYLTCHFIDDPVKPGTLMFECALHALRMLLMAQGWIIDERDAPDDLHFAPLPEVGSRLRCRGQVVPETKEALYQVDIKEIGYDPAPYVLADAYMFADGRRIVEVENASLRLVGGSAGLFAQSLARRGADAGPLFDERQVLAFTDGQPSQAFGPRFAAFDDGRRFLARLPRDPYSFISRVVRSGQPFFEMSPGGEVVSEYDVPPDAWYFDAAGCERMPFAVLLEAVLQGCGWTSTWVGSALRSEGPLHYRNLDGDATVLREVGRDAGKLVSRTRLTSVSEAAGMIIHGYDMRVELADGSPVLEGTTVFGFFSPAALARQVGVPGGDQRAWPPPDGGQRATVPAAKWSFLDDTLLHTAGGPQGLGWGRGSSTVDPATWYFHAHFKDDPVMPGSLGLEALLQLMERLLRAKLAEAGQTTEGLRLQSMAIGARHNWAYRGQVIPAAGQVEVEASVTDVILGAEPCLTADGLLRVDGLVIYTMTSFQIRLVAAGEN